jgi:catechol 2,3-dioxygenase-like lactoylglutathione lyase family enzyme
MPDQLVNVRYMVDDVENAVDFYTTHFGFTPRSGIRRRRARQPATTAQWADQLGGEADARRPHPGARGLEPHPLRGR